jgi:hypothetical protein
MSSEMTLTYQTRILSTDDQEAILQGYAHLMNSVEHALLQTHKITARQFNACRDRIHNALLIKNKIIFYLKTNKTI